MFKYTQKNSFVKGQSEKDSKRFAAEQVHSVMRYLKFFGGTPYFFRNSEAKYCGDA